MVVKHMEKTWRKKIVFIANKYTYTVCPKGQVKIYFIITWARKHSMILERWHFLH